MDEEIELNQIDEPDNNQPQQANEGRSTNFKPWIYYTIITILFILTGTLVISHTSFALARFALNEQPCENNTDHDYEFLSEEYSDLTNEMHLYYHFSQFLYCMLSFLHWFEYGYLFYGLLCFVYSYNTIEANAGGNDPEQQREEEKIVLKYSYADLLKSTESNWERRPNPLASQKKTVKTKIQPALLLFVFIAFFAITIASPAIDIKIFHSGTHNRACEVTYGYIAINYIYHASTLITRTLTVFVRMLLVIAVSMCGLIWLKKPLRELKSPFNNSEGDDENRKVAERRYGKIRIDYRARMALAKPIYKVFRSWFVFQWIHYIFRLSHDLVYLLRPWIWHETLPGSNKLSLIRNTLNCLYDLLAILSLYLPALKMNAYLRRYVRRQQQKQREEALRSRSEAQYAYSETDLKIEMIPRSVFIPRVPGFGINISLRGPGFIIATAILVLGSVATFSKF